MRIITFLLLLFIALPTYAADAPKAVTEIVPPDQLAKQAEEYLNSIHTLVARFYQVSPDGTESQGTFYLSRPGKFRWQYDPPMPVLIVGRDDLITYFDSELDEITYLTVEDSLASFLTSSTIRFVSKTVEITDLAYRGHTLRVTLGQKKKPEEGTMTLVFKDNPMTLIRMEANDLTGGKTSVRFEGLRYGENLDDKLFIIPNPKYKKK
jgi:outer membrane lipoprotein-sorting protein